MVGNNYITLLEEVCRQLVHVRRRSPVGILSDHRSVAGRILRFSERRRALRRMRRATRAVRRARGFRGRRSLPY
jgi:hypothetical protein